MFDDEILEKIFMHPDTRKIPIAEVAIMIRVIEEILTEVEENKNAVSKS